MRKADRKTVLRPFFGFYGGKWRDTPRLYSEPEYDVIVEPFAGSAGYSLRFPENKVVLCERDPVLAGLWKYLLEVDEGEILGLPDLGPEDSVDDLDVRPEARHLIGFWLNRGVSAPRKRPSKWMRSGIRPGSFWGSRVRETIASQLPRIRHWKIHQVTFEDCPVEGEATWFIDPPYQLTGHHYRFGSGLIDYPELAAWCLEREGQVMVCETEGADWLDFHPLPSTKTTRRGQRSQEVIWTNNGRMIPDGLIMGEDTGLGFRDREEAS